MSDFHKSFSSCLWHTSWLARFLKLMLYHKVSRDMAVKKTTSFCFNDGSIESLQNTNLENIFTDSEPCYTFPPANIYRWYSSHFCFSLWCAPSVLTSIWSWNHIDYMPFHCGASQYESSNVFHLVMRIYIHCNHHGSVAFVMNLLRLLLTLVMLQSDVSLQIVFSAAFDITKIALMVKRYWHRTT